MLLKSNLNSVQANCIIQNDIKVLPLISTAKTRHLDISIDDVHIIKKHGLEVSEMQLEENDYSILNCTPLSALTENVVCYTASFVLKIVKQTINKCDMCLLSLEDIPTASLHVGDVPLLRDAQNQCVLTKPSSDFVAVLIATETYLQKVLATANEDLLAEASFCDIFSRYLAVYIFSMNKYFLDLVDHVMELSLYENNHVMRLIRESIYSYSKIRLYNVTKKQIGRNRGQCIKNYLRKIICNQ